MKLASLQDLFIEGLNDLYDAEEQILKALPEMAEAASSIELKNAFQEHLAQTKNQVRRLETILEGLAGAARRQKCEGMKGLLKEGKELMERDATPSVRDVALIAAAQKVEHYEIAGYGCVRTYAEVLGNEEAGHLLQQTLDEEEATDRKLTDLAEWTVNQRAVKAA